MREGKLIMNTLLGFMGLGTTELMIVAGIFILLFGSTKLPGLARSIGKSANEFKKGIRDDSPLDDEGDDADEDNSSDEEDDGDE
jgi:sec-independent protein translocase protein TatA